jgi:hypothetical protein
MHALRTAATLLLVMAAFSTGARSQCDLTGFGAHELPPAPLRAPPVNDRYADFEWGTDAYRDNDYWWNWNFIKNDAATAPLALDWKKGGITLPIANPLPPGLTACRKRLLGNTTQPVPILDQTAPITYSVSNQVQEAAVFIAAVLERRSSNLIREEDPSFDRFQTTYQDLNGKPIPVHVDIGTTGAVGKDFSIYLYVEPKSLVIGLSGVSKFWNRSQIEIIQTQFTAQGFGTMEAPLFKFADPGTAQQLHLADEVANGDFLFVSGGTRAEARYPASANTVVQRRACVLIILENLHAIASEEVSINVPSSDAR